MTHPSFGELAAAVTHLSLGDAAGVSGVVMTLGARSLSVWAWAAQGHLFVYPPNSQPLGDATPHQHNMRGDDSSTILGNPRQRNFLHSSSL